YKYGHHLLLPDQSETSETTAASFFECAVNHGCHEAIYSLVYCYASGTGGVATDTKKALKWLVLGAEKKEKECVAALARLYNSDSVYLYAVERNEPFASAWLTGLSNKSSNKTQ